MITRRQFGLLSASALAHAAVRDLEGKSKGLIRHNGSPYLLESSLSDLDGRELTPYPNFFVLARNPPVEQSRNSWQLRIEGLVGSAITIPASRLLSPRFAQYDVVSVLQCAGFGRTYFEPRIADVPWGRGAVGNARWTGVRLRDVLSFSGVRSSARYIYCQGTDGKADATGSYMKSLPMDKATADETLVAVSMNGQAIPWIHGGPLRLIVPGWYGTYSVKWLSRLVASDSPPSNFWMARAYRLPRTPVTPGYQTWDPADGVPVTTLAPNSIITSPAEAYVSTGPSLEVRGFAWAGDAGLSSIEVSLDDGVSWLVHSIEQPASFGWRPFRYSFAERGDLRITVRARDRSGRSQPAIPAWNPFGYCWNGPHRVTSRVVSGRTSK